MAAIGDVITPPPTSQGTTRLLAMLDTALGPLLPYLDDPRIIEIMSNPDGQLWIERAGEPVVLAPERLAPEATERIIRLLAGLAHTVVNYGSPSFTGTLPKWDCRVHADMPPVVVAPALTIRKRARQIYTLDDYVAADIMTARQRDLLIHAVRARQNILVSGGTGSGKTTLTNALLDRLRDTRERVLLIEDNRELQCGAPNLYALYTYSYYPLARAIADSLRRRPDRIIVGEVRDVAALDLLKAWNTGHPGGIATVHANSERLALDRVCEMIEEKNGVANKAFVARSVDVIIHIARDLTSRGHRRVTGLVAVADDLVDGHWCLRALD